MTDGVAEALDRPGDRLGQRLLLSLVGEAPRDLDQLMSRLLGAVERERVLRQLDDITVLGLEVVG